MPNEAAKKPGEYWAALPQSDAYVGQALQHIISYRKWLSETGRADRIMRSFRARYGWSPEGNGNTSQVQTSGTQGELVDVTTNDFAALMDQSQTLITSQKPAFKAVANNGDYKSLAQVKLAEGIIQDYERKEALSEMDSDTVRSALLASEGWRIQGWDASRGRIIANDADGNGIAEGDIVEYSLTPLDIALDPKCKSVERLPWIAFKVPYSRFDLIALLPDLAAQLAAAGSATATSATQMGDWDTRYDLSSFPGWRPSESDDFIDVWEVRHLPSPALPRGRLVRFVDEGCVLYDSMRAKAPMDPTAQPGAEPQLANAGYPYGRELFAYCLTPERVLGSTSGHSAHFDLLGLQQCMDTVVTMAASAANAGGLTNIWSPDQGDNLTVTEVGGGLNHIKSTVKPEEISGPSLDPQVPAFGRLIMELMRRRIGLNDAALGEPTKGMPAQLAALLQAQAVQFHNGLQSSYQRMLELTRTGRLKLLKTFPAKKRVAEIAGVNDSWTLTEWQPEDLSAVERVSVEAINPAMRTLAGRMSLGQLLLDKEQITGAQFLQLVITGRLDDEWEFAAKNKARIQAEKEMLAKGASLPPVDPIQSQQAGRPIFAIPPPVPNQPPVQYIMPHVGQTHWLDIPEYLAVIASPEANSQANIVKNVTDLVTYKIELWRQMDPALILLLKGQPCPPKMDPMMMGMGPPGMPGMGPPPPPSGGPPGPDMANVPGSGPKRPIKQPRPPKDPITGEQPPSPMP